MKFKQGDLVVVEDDVNNTIHCVEDTFEDGAVFLQDSSERFEEDQLILVKSSDLPPEVPTPIVPNTPDRTIEDIHDDIQKMFVQIVQYYEKQEVDKKLDLSINAEYYPGSNDITVKYTASIGYGKNIESRSLFKSVQIACERFREDEAIKPKEIPFYKHAE